MMDDSHEDWLKAGRIAGEAREYAKTIIRPGKGILEAAEMIEAKIALLGAMPAFPVNISFNDIAAHYTPIHSDDIVFLDQVVKVDVGVCFNGAIGDTACTIDLSGKHSEMVKASEEALSNALKMMVPGTRIGEIGRTIMETIASYSYSPIKNLSGHGLGPYSVHEKPSIPNFDTGENAVLKEGMHLAVEPFATDGAGMIKESANAMIYSQVGSRPVRSPFARDILRDIQAYKGMPFASRWLSKKHGEGKTRLALRELQLAGNLRDYPPLIEVRKGIVTQAEHSVIVGEKPIITTSWIQ
jgi:methionyl aminopeptidase